MVLVPACGGGNANTAEAPSPTATEPSAPASTAAPAEPAPLTAYREYWDTINKAYANPTRDWSEELAQVAADPDLLPTRDDLQRDS